jgi:NADH-quinone oxidoreductase subunit J
LFLILSFAAVAGLYVTLSADFLAAVQLLVYAGGIAILIVFAVMMTHNTMSANTENRQWLSAAVIAMLAFVLIGTVVITAVWPVSAVAPLEITTEAIAHIVFNQYVLPFEVASVLLLAAMVGALVMARGRNQ